MATFPFGFVNWFAADVVVGRDAKLFNVIFSVATVVSGLPLPASNSASPFCFNLLGWRMDGAKMVCFGGLDTFVRSTVSPLFTNERCELLRSTEWCEWCDILGNACDVFAMVVLLSQIIYCDKFVAVSIESNLTGSLTPSMHRRRCSSHVLNAARVWFCSTSADGTLTDWMSNDFVGDLRILFVGDFLTFEIDGPRSIFTSSPSDFVFGIFFITISFDCINFSWGGIGNELEPFVDSLFKNWR